MTSFIPLHAAMKLVVCGGSHTKGYRGGNRSQVMARRTRLGFLDVKVALQVLPRVLDLMQEELGVRNFAWPHLISHLCPCHATLRY